MTKVKTSFFCQNCGSQYAKWLGQCNSCNQWNTIVAGKCDSPDAILSFAPSKTKFLRFVLTDNLEEDGEIPWSMRQLKIFGILQNDKLIN